MEIPISKFIDAQISMEFWIHIWLVNIIDVVVEYKLYSSNASKTEHGSCHSARPSDFRIILCGVR